MDSGRDNPGEPVPEETFTHSHLCVDLTEELNCWNMLTLAATTTTTVLGPLPGQSGTRKAEPFWNLMKQEMIGCKWHQLNHMQIICTLLQTDNHASTSPLKFLQAGCPSRWPVSNQWRWYWGNCNEARCIIACKCGGAEHSPLVGGNVVSFDWNLRLLMKRVMNADAPYNVQHRVVRCRNHCVQAPCALHSCTLSVHATWTCQTTTHSGWGQLPLSLKA